MIDYEVHRCSRRCAATDQEFTPGQAIYSVLVSEGKEVVRRDYARSAWQGPPEGAIGWWKAIVPNPNTKRVALTPADVLLGYFEELADDPLRADVRYLLALLMIRRKLLRQEDVETDEQGNEVLVAASSRSDAIYRVRVVMPTVERMSEVQQELNQLLQAGDGENE